MKTKLQFLLLALCTISLSAFSQTKVNLYFFSDGEEIHEQTNVTAGASYSLAHITDSLRNANRLKGCRGYVFYGWVAGGPLESGATPDTVKSVKPQANMNLHAVYVKENISEERYVRISSTADLENGAQYVLTCYYDHDGNTYYGPQYFALTTTEHKYDRYQYGAGYRYYYGLDAEQVRPEAGAIVGPSAEKIWKLTGSTNAWKLTNEGVSKSLYINNNKNQQILTDGGNTFSITATNGAFNFVKDNNWRLSYSGDAQDYFRTTQSNNWTFYLFKKESPYTSFPSCRLWSVVLDAVDGTVGTTGKHRDTIPEASADAGVKLPNAVKPTEATCSGWNFAGWHVGEPLRNEAERTPSLYAEDDVYEPNYDGEVLYAVYLKDGIYTSYPRCVKYKVYLHGCGGTVDTLGNSSLEEVREQTVTGGIKLPSATPRCPDEGWAFVGWMEGGDVSSYKDVKFDEPMRRGTTFAPTHDGTHLYAVYRRLTDRFRIVIYGTIAANSQELLIPGDNYLITYYTKSTNIDHVLSSVAYDNTHLSGVDGVSPMDGTDYYLIAPDSALWWKADGTEGAWTFYNVSAKRYLNVENNQTTTSETVQTYGISGRGNSATLTSNRNLIIYRTSGSYHYCLNYNGTYFTANNDNYYYFSNNGKTTSCGYATSYLYRQIKEYTSWPHCGKFLVNFDACGGTVQVDSLRETAPYSGIELPDASVNSDCAKEGWTFAGWAKAPVENEQDTLSFDLYPARTLYIPPQDSATLYAVYCQKTNEYKKISSDNKLFLGVNYIITSGNNALANTASATRINATTAPNPVNNVITWTNAAAAEWLLIGEKGEYVLYNVAGNNYVNLSSAGNGTLSDTIGDNFYITSNGGTFTIRSNMSDAMFDGSKYMYYYNSKFYTNTSGNATSLTFYQQQAVYYSRPYCAEPIDAVMWTKEGNSYYVYVESYEAATKDKKPRMDNSTGSPELQMSGDMMGTWKINYDTTILKPNAKTPFAWGSKNAALRIPYLITGNSNTSVLRADCSECDVVVAPGGTFTINNDKAVHNITIYDGGTLTVAEDKTLTVKSLTLRSEGDQASPTVNINGTLVIDNENALYRDLRLDENRYYWFTFPYEVSGSGISYASLEANGGKAPVYRTDYWIKYYNGALRAADVNGGGLASSYWTHVPNSFTLQAGQGYIVGIANQKTKTQADGRKHAKRLMRFTMNPNKTQWNTSEKSSQKATNVSPSSAENNRNAVHVGWNLIGNPYLKSYSLGSPGGNSGLQNGTWIKERVDGAETGWYIINESDPNKGIPYATIYHHTTKKNGKDSVYYEQVLTSSKTLRPFEPIFVQINTGDQIYFKSAGVSRTNMPAYMRFLEEDAPVRTGITVNGAGQTDATGVVLSEEYSPEYEIGADLVKMSNDGALNLYTINADNQQLAFNGLSDEDAEAEIPVGITLPALGEYTFAFDAEQYNMNAMDTVMLIDHANGSSVNLLYANYTFQADEVGTINNRFALLVRRAQSPQVPTDVDNIYDPNAPRKVIRDGQLFIICDDKVYNAVGVEVK